MVRRPSRPLRSPHRLRQLFVDRATHCAFTASEEIVTLKTLFERIDTGRLPRSDPARLRRAAGRFRDPYQLVYDFATNQDWAVSPAFTTFTPTEPPTPLTMRSVRNAA